jgi:O-antigen ligase
MNASRQGWAAAILVSASRMVDKTGTGHHDNQQDPNPFWIGPAVNCCKESTLAAKFLSHSTRPLGSLRRVQWLVYHLLSFETFFLLFLYGNQIRSILPPIPGNEAMFFGAITMAIGGWIIFRDGLYLGGMPIVLTGLLLIGWMVLSVGWSPSRVLVWESLRFLLTVDLWALVAGACIIAASRERVARLFVMIAGLALILSTYGIYIEFAYGSFRFYHYLGAGADWAGSAYIAWGYIVTNGAVVILAFGIFSKLGSPKQLLAVLALATCGYFLLIASGRGPLLGLLLAGLLAAVIQAPRIGHGRVEFSQTQIAALCLLALATVYVGYLYATGQTGGAISRFLRLFDEADDPLLRTGANRFDYFAFAYQLWLEAPLVGQGLSSFAIIYGAGREVPGTYPHNAILQILAEFGIVGLVLFTVFIVAGLRNISLARLRRDQLSLLLVMMFIAFFLQTMVMGDFAKSYRFFFIVGLLAMRPLAEENDDEEEDKKDQDKEEDGDHPLIGAPPRPTESRSS